MKNVKGLSWGAAAVGNAIWSGPKLCDILNQMGVKSNETHHVHVCVGYYTFFDNLILIYF